MYKNVAQNTSVSSVEMVIQHFVTKSKEKLDEALAKVDEIEGPLVTEAGTDAATHVDDLEATETPESLLLSTVSEEKTRDRTYRELVTPWLRSLWEAYRTALDILRNNSRLENFYQVCCHILSRLDRKKKSKQSQKEAHLPGMCDSFCTANRHGGFRVLSDSHPQDRVQEISRNSAI